VQVDPMEHALKAPGSMLLKLIHDKLVSTFAFELKLRRYTEVRQHGIPFKLDFGEVYWNSRLEAGLRPGITWSRTVDISFFQTYIEP